MLLQLIEAKLIFTNVNKKRENETRTMIFNRRHLQGFAKHHFKVVPKVVFYQYYLL